MLRVLGARKKEIVTIMIITGVKTALKGALVGLAFGFAIILMQNYFSIHSLAFRCLLY